VSNNFRPMLACETPEPLEKLVVLGHFPMYASYKLDGIRAVVKDGVVLSRTLKPIPSKFVQDTFRGLEGFDGELGTGNPCSSTFYRDTFSAVMTHGCQTPVKFYVFDRFWGYNGPYSARLRSLDDLATELEPKRVEVLYQDLVDSVDGVLNLEGLALNLGYEGLILRRQDAPYKFGRSTLNQGYLVKIKRTLDAEAEIVGFEELMHNSNEAKVDARGLTTRTSHQANLVGMDTLGALIVRNLKDGVEFKIGVFKDFDKSELQRIWNSRNHGQLGRIVKYRYLPYGIKDKPRHPRMVGFRDPSDM